MLLIRTARELLLTMAARNHTEGARHQHKSFYKFTKKAKKREFSNVLLFSDQLSTHATATILDTLKHSDLNPVSFTNHVTLSKLYDNRL